MICYKDRTFCMRDCGRIECRRNKAAIPWENQLPVCYMRGDDCTNWESVRDREERDYYETEE